jgi:hypothetical protein
MADQNKNSDNGPLSVLQTPEAQDVLISMIARGIRAERQTAEEEAKAKARVSEHELDQAKKFASTVASQLPKPEPRNWSKRAIFTGAMIGGTVVAGGLAAFGMLHSTAPVTGYYPE